VVSIQNSVTILDKTFDWIKKVVFAFNSTSNQNKEIRIIWNVQMSWLNYVSFLCVQSLAC